MSATKHTKKRKNDTNDRESAITIVQFRNGRRTKQEHRLSEQLVQQTKSNAQPLPETDILVDRSDEASEYGFVLDDTTGAFQRKTKTQNDMLSEWKKKEAQYMDALLNFEAICAALTCAQCHRRHESLFRCLTCLGRVDYCQSCITSLHRGMPFHRIALWDPNSGCFLTNISLGSLGLTLSLGHNSHSFTCPHPSTPCNLTVVHTNGLHDIPVQFCTCADSTTPDLQIFGYRLFPSTVHTPQTAFSFDVLEQFRFHHLEGKTSAYTFMNALLRLTDDTGHVKKQDRTREFRRVFRQWSYLKASKSAGRYGPGFGDIPLVVSCPACPHPGKNIPEQWPQRFPHNEHWLHRQFIHFDANFRLTLEKRTNRTESGSVLWTSPGYFVDTDKYQEYLLATASSRQEVSECVDHKALLNGPKRRFESLEVSGVAGAVCRHECAIPQSFANLSHGERYVNSDYGISSAMRNMHNIQEIVLSYDIACQYSRHFTKRFTSSPYLELPDAGIVFAVPKFHLPAHKEDCRYFYSFNYLKHVGRTDGEAIERFWSTHNHLSGSTSRMSPEGRLDTLNAHFADWNWRKLCGMGQTLLLRLQDAHAQVASHSAKYNDLCASLDADLIQRWVDLDDNYEPSLDARAIYQLAVDNIPSQISILRELSQVDNPVNARQDHMVTDVPAVAIWINEGLEMEDAQRSLRVQAASINDGSTEREQVLLNRRRASLYHRLVAWRRTSPFEEDDVGDSDEEDANNNTQFENMQIPLPSNLPNVRLTLLPRLSWIEQQLRSGQAYDALKQLRRALALMVALKRESRNSRGQHQNLRSKAALKRVNSDIALIVTRYNAAHSALSRMNAIANYPDLCVLTASDITAFNVFEASRPLGRGYDSTVVSWIWNMRGVADETHNDNWLEEVLRVQFLDVKATLDRWKEEEMLVGTEMRRTADYFGWMGGVWSRRAVHGESAGSRAHASSMWVIYANLERDVRLKIL